MPETSANSANAVNRWVTRLVPILIVGTTAFATWDIAYALAIEYLYRRHNNHGAAIAILVLYFLFFLLAIASYLRTFYTIKTDAGLVPLPANAASREDRKRRRSYRRAGKRPARDIEALRYDAAVNGPDPNPDSPGLELFYSRDAFICEDDGRPKWCSECRNWRPDRSHHSKEIGRCVRKMDHYCPWVGGMVSETSFKFFAQFTFYTAMYCLVIIAVSVYCLEKKAKDGIIDGATIALLALGFVFGVFTCSMSAATVRFCITNITNIDMLKAPVAYQVAVRVPRGTRPTEEYMTITYPLPKPAPAANGQPNGQGDITIHQAPGTDVEAAPAARDQLATRTFAIVRAQVGENPWDLGAPLRNWQTVFGTNILDWILPIRRSPCTNHESMVSDYEFGPLLGVLRARYGLAEYRESMDYGNHTGHVRENGHGGGSNGHDRGAWGRN